MTSSTGAVKQVNTDDILSALRSKHLGYLGIDAYAEEALSEIATTTMNNISLFSKGEKPKMKCAR